MKERIENNTEKNMYEKVWDVIVIGGGPAGMMAAARAAEILNAKNDEIESTAQPGKSRVLLVEKNETLGKKLLITGGGRCNVTNSELDTRKFLEKFKDAGKFLFSAFSQYGVQEALDFFHMQNVETKIENELRTFPLSNSAQSIWDALFNNLMTQHVTVLSLSPVTEIIREQGNIVGVKIKNQPIIYGHSIIIATGGTSRPETGSTGDAYAWLRDLGHTVIEPTPSLVPLVLKESWIKRLAGVSIPDVKITVLQNNQKQETKKGKILFTHVGVSGPTILNMSRDIGELLKYGEVALSLDILPGLDYGMLNSRLQEIFKLNDKKKLQNALADLVPTALVSTILEISQINGDTPCNSVTREERLKLVETIKSIPLHVEKLLGVEKAIITSGGVALDEVDFKTMRSRLYPNLYLIGDILNIDRPSGGYSLQLCWTTGYVAGSSIEN